jgi:predicted dehydrogenase
VNKIRLAIIGCGAVTELYHLPVLTGIEQVTVVVLVDKVSQRASELAKRFNIPEVTTNFQDVFGRVDAAIVAVPHYLHAPVAVDLMRHGIHILVEKPMALSTNDCDEMIKTASDSGVILTVGMVCRFYRASQLMKQLIEDGLFGDITSFLDLLQWWLGDYEKVEYYDDNMGGVEADCEIYLTMKNGAKGVIKLSRTRRLRNTYILKGKREEVEIDCSFNPLIRLKSQAMDLVLEGQVALKYKRDSSILDAFGRQFEDFLASIINGKEPFVTPESAKKAVKLIEKCKAVRQELNQDWMKFKNE